MIYTFYRTVIYAIHRTVIYAIHSFSNQENTLQDLMGIILTPCNVVICTIEKVMNENVPVLTVHSCSTPTPASPDQRPIVNY